MDVRRAVRNARRRADLRKARRPHGVGDQLAVFVGDSYTSGTPIGGRGRRGYPSRVADALGMRYAVHAVGGSGYAARGTGFVFADHADAVIAQRPALLVVAGSGNDRVASDRVEAAATGLLGRLTEVLPAARVVVVGPMWPESSPTVLAARDGVAAASARLGLPFVDPLDEGWFAQDGLIGADGRHPTDAGHRVIAERLLPSLRL